MKQHILFSTAVGLLITAAISFAQVPRTFSYQGYVTTSSGTPISNGTHGVTITLYTSPSGGSAVLTETQNVGVTDGIFSMVIPAPPSLSFANQYYLGIAVDGGPEMAPLTPLTSVPSAMSAGQAESLAPGATGVVRSVNGLSGDVTFQGGGGTTVTQSGSTVTISSSGGSGGSGIQGVQNSDGTIAIQNPNGPVATISVANGGIIPAKISTTGSSNGQVLTSNGSSVVWGTPPSGLTLPFEGSVENPSNGIKVTTNGKGSALYGVSTSLGVPVEGYSTGSGRAGAFVIANRENNSNALFALTDGTGSAVEGYAIRNANAGYFHIDYPTGAKDALIAETNTAGAAFVARQRGSGNGANFYIDSASNRGDAIYARTLGSGSAVKAFVNGNGRVIDAWSNGQGDVGYFEVNRADGGGAAVYAKTEGTGNAVTAEYAGSNTAGTALELKNGYIKVSGANKTAFVHTTTTTNTAARSHITSLTYPGAAASDILLVTHKYNGVYIPAGTSYSVWWNSANWTIYLDDTTKVMPIGATFNVLVIKQ